jgi:hypothetical protein
VKKLQISISYAYSDSTDIVNALYRSLINTGYSVTRPTEDISLGENYRKNISDEISCCDLFVLIITSAALLNSFVETEFLEARKLRKVVIPCRHKSVALRDLKWGLQEIKGIEFDSIESLLRELLPSIANISDLADQQSIAREVSEYLLPTMIISHIVY